jgi:hypothetical protein
VLERLGELPPQRRPRRVRAGVRRLARVGVEVVRGLGAGRVAHVLPRLLVDHPDRRLEPAVGGRGPRAPQRSGVVPGALILRQDGCVPYQLGRLAPGPVQHGLVEALGADPSVLHAAADELLGPEDEQRHVEQLLVHRSDVADQAVLARVSDDDDHGVVQPVQAVEQLQQLAEAGSR